MTKGRSVPSSPRTQKSVEGRAPLAPPPGGRPLPNGPAVGRRPPARPAVGRKAGLPHRPAARRVWNEFQRSDQGKSHRTAPVPAQPLGSGAKGASRPARASTPGAGPAPSPGALGELRRSAPSPLHHLSGAAVASGRAVLPRAHPTAGRRAAHPVWRARSGTGHLRPLVLAGGRHDHAGTGALRVCGRPPAKESKTRSSWRAFEAYVLASARFRVAPPPAYICLLRGWCYTPDTPCPFTTGTTPYLNRRL